MILIALGFLPGLFSGFCEAIMRFSSSIRTGLPVQTFRAENTSQPVWLAVLGTCLILFSILAYL